MIRLDGFLAAARPFHICVSQTGHIRQVGKTLDKIAPVALVGSRFLEAFEVYRPARPTDLAQLLDLVGRVLKLRLRAAPDIQFKGMVTEDGDGGVILDLSFGITVVEAVREHGLTVSDFAASDLAVELLFLQEAKSIAMDASFSLNARLDGARLAAETKALTDGLTGLRNRRALDAALARLTHAQTDFAVLHMDLDYFKAVNDTLGHAVGDHVLRDVAGAMRRHTRKDDFLARTGGDEFVILCPGLTDELRLGELSQSLIDTISKPQDVDGHQVTISASIGIAIRQSHAAPDMPDVLEAADIALYAAKRQGRECYVSWSAALGTSLTELALPPDPGRDDAKKTEVAQKQG